MVPKHFCFLLMQCAPEYKVPGLYVIDSIVRQSRHQFGHDKDLYGPRFSKNFEKTFRNLFICPPNDQVHLRHCYPPTSTDCPSVMINFLAVV